MNQALYTFYKKRKKSPPLKKLPPTDLNLMLHTLRAHLQALLQKAADKDGPPTITNDITKFGWEVNENGVMPVIADQPIGPPRIIDIISCNCSAEGTACSTKSCLCSKQNLSCTKYCKFEAQVCMNPNTVLQDEEDANEDEDEDDKDVNDL